MILACITSPLALLLYGFGIQEKMHWIVPTLGLFFSKSLGLSQAELF
jgi:hypothetical protein